MENDFTPEAEANARLRVFGVGDAGIQVIELLMADGMDPAQFVALNADGPGLENSAAIHRLRLETKRLRGLGSGGDPERARQAAEEKQSELQKLCEGVKVILIVAGLGGGAGSGITPVVARIAKASGALVLVFVTTPFDCEGNRRQTLAEEALQQLHESADGVIRLPNQKIFKLIHENTTVLDTFKITNRLMADGLDGVSRLVSLRGLIEIHLSELCRVLQEGHSESTFAVAEASGAARADRIIQRLVTHPLLEEGETLARLDSVLISLTGGSDLTMAEVNRVTQEIQAKCGSAEAI